MKLLHWSRLAFAALNFLFIDSCSSGEKLSSDDHPTRWIYEAMGAWDERTQNPHLCNMTGKGIGIAIVEGPNYNVGHPALKNSNISLIDFGGVNISIQDHGRRLQYHANHVTALIAGKPDQSYDEMDFEYLILINQHNPKLAAAYSPNSIPSYKYFGGLAPEAKIYAYSRIDKDKDERQELQVILKIFEDIASKEDIQIINLSCMIGVTPAIITQLNQLAKQGKIFVHAVGNNGYNLDAQYYQNREAFNYYDGACRNDFSSIFWSHHIWVGALNCYKSKFCQAQIERWKDSSYYIQNDSLHNKNFVMAPGSCIFSAAQDGYALRSGTSMATAFVTGALACALEANSHQNKDSLISKMLSNRYDFQGFYSKHDVTNIAVLNIKKLLDATISDYSHSLPVSINIPVPQAAPDEPLQTSCHFDVPLPLLDHHFYSNDHPTRWFYEAINAWDNKIKAPTTFGLTGKGVSIALIEEPHFNLQHPALKKSNIEIVNTYSSCFKLRGHKRINAKVVFGSQSWNGFACLPSSPCFSTCKGENKPYITNASEQCQSWHTNHVTALIAGKTDTSFSDMDLDYLFNLRKNNPNLEKVSYSPNSVPDFVYFGGLAPDARIYAYPRNSDRKYEKDILCSIFFDIENKEDIRLISLGNMLEVNRPMIDQLNLLAEKGKIFVQPIGNRGLDFDRNNNKYNEPIQYIEGASFNNFSQKFWQQHIWVGALASYKNASSEVSMDIWKGSSYYANRMLPHKNFVMAPGACILSPSYNHYSLNSGTGIATAFVTGALACALEANSTQEPAHLIAKLLQYEHDFKTSTQECIKLPVLNIRNLTT